MVLKLLEDKSNHYFCDRCLYFNHLAVSKADKFLTMNIASFDINVRLYILYFLGQPGFT